jgi:hypothetical protein
VSGRASVAHAEFDDPVRLLWPVLLGPFLFGFTLLKPAASVSMRCGHMACQTRILWNQVLSSSSACAAGPPYGWKPVCRGRRRWDGRGCATGSSKPESLITWAAITLMTRRITRRTFRCTGQQTSREHERD